MTVPVSDIHKVGEVAQRTGVVRAYAIDVSNRGTPTSPSNTLYAHTDFTTNLTGNISGSPSVSSQTITTSLITGLTGGLWYRLEVSFTVSGNTEEAYIDIYCTDTETVS